MFDEVELEEVASLAPVGTEATGRRWKAKLISGDTLGSMAFYPAEVLATQGPKVFKKGTPIFLDHQTPEERELRPWGSVSNFAGELAEDAYYDGDGLYAEIEVFENHAPMIKAIGSKIGMSIRALTKTEKGERDGRIVPVVKELVRARSVDFVVKAGAGGKLVQVLESAQIDESTDSEQEEENTVMDEATKELLESLVAGQTAANQAISELAESLKGLKVGAEEETEEAAAVNPLDVAKALADSELSESGRERVFELHKATGKDLQELIESEKAHEKKLVDASEVSENAGVEESASAEVEESASGKSDFATPKQWKVSN